jgi:glycerol-3-phosphate dehydrogenase
MKRDLAEFQRAAFDLLVVGGGVTGASIARDAALRGLRVALIEARDFGGANSANSLKIVHGGLRYLQHLDMPRMRASIRERSTWLRIAPHLVEPLPVVAPAWQSGRHRLQLLRAALAINDVVSFDRNRGVDPDRQLPAGRQVSREECLRLVPELESPALTGGVLFHDAQMYSAERLTLAVVRGAAAAGAVVANYVECSGPLLGAGALAGVVALDRLTGTRFRIRARFVANAAGGEADAVVGRLLGRPPRSITPLSIAVNLQLPGRGHRVAFSLPDADFVNERRGKAGRQLFVTPWRGTTLFGTGHFPLEKSGAASVQAERAAEAFLAEVNRSWPGEPLRPDDVEIVHSGFLPVSRAGGVHLLKRHRIIDHAEDGAPSLLTIHAVKYTTARLVAQEVVDRVVSKRGGSAAPCRTMATPLPGAPRAPLAVVLNAAMAHPHGLADGDALAHLVRSHGDEWHDVLTGHTDVPGWAERVVPGAPVIGAQLAHAVRHEMACTVDDLLLRRTEIGARGRVTNAARAAAAAILEWCRPDGGVAAEGPSGQPEGMTV